MQWQAPSGAPRGAQSSRYAEARPPLPRHRWASRSAGPLNTRRVIAADAARAPTFANGPNARSRDALGLISTNGAASSLVQPTNKSTVRATCATRAFTSLAAGSGSTPSVGANANPLIWPNGCAASRDAVWARAQTVSGLRQQQ
jgi:hypothetical protein